MSSAGEQLRDTGIVPASPPVPAKLAFVTRVVVLSNGARALFDGIKDTWVYVKAGERAETVVHRRGFPGMGMTRTNAMYGPGCAYARWHFKNGVVSGIVYAMGSGRQQAAGAGEDAGRRSVERPVGGNER